MKNVTFLHPEFFWLFLLLPLAIGWFIYSKKKQTATIKMSTLAPFKNNRTLLSRLKPLLFVLRILGLSTIIVALARPRSVDVTAKSRTTRGIDIVMALDVSGSMLAKDLKPNRLDALKRVASTFIEDRVNDRIGLVVYAGESYTRTPVTSDKTVVLQSLKTVEYDDSIIADGTGIGVGLATAINRLKDSKAKSRIIILLTDGVNNSGTIDPRMAADIAKQYGIKVYTIGIGTNGMAPFPYAKDANGRFLFRNMQVEIDEGLMKEIAKTTDGKYFRATSNKKLEEIYSEINKLETTEVEEKKYFNYDEKFKPFIWFAFGLLLIEIILRNTVFRGFV
ncbi:aerotolerance regulator BatA [Flavobacterium sp. 316]|uniref:VWA domain-containing protein n=1 Tax=Flavobacterium sediminilitoris TaxID=2024526 RepID=A0ABY4HQB7_9FLAO|nr:MULTISPECIES: VWA domain-containing protein [Flavobacterium]KIX20607.1 aerotolerance regulator BatA [Flavobacterium sp. 316]UOX34805.1 VWA domain-containing protein [Flavobacterium sediminilitoris]